MTNPSELFFKLVEQLQQYRRKIEPVLSAVERGKLLLDKLEQAKQAESKIRQARLIMDAVDDSLDQIKRELETFGPSVSQLSQMAESLSSEEIEQLIEIFSKRGSEWRNREHQAIS